MWESAKIGAISSNHLFISLICSTIPPCDLPLFSLSRGLVAYGISLGFTLVYGYWAAKDATLAKAKSAGARVLVEPYSAADRRSALVQFPGGYIAEIHATLRN